MIEPSLASSAGETVPQYGQTSACFAALQWASAPHAGQWCLLSAATSGRGGGTSGSGGGVPPGIGGGASATISGSVG